MDWRAIIDQVTQRNGNSIDWQQELQQHDRWLRTIVHARLGEPGAVDDVMQEVALAAVRQSSPIADVTKVAPWLYRLAIRQALLYRRKMGRKRNLTNRYAEKFRPTETDTSRRANPLAWLLANERNKLVREAIDLLRQTDSQILMLKYAENWSYHQIADHLGVSHSAVEARLHRARGRLRQLLVQKKVVEEQK